MEETTIHLSSCYITGQWGRVQNKIKETEPKTLTLILNLLLSSIVFHNKTMSLS